MTTTALGRFALILNHRISRQQTREGETDISLETSRINSFYITSNGQ